MIEDEASGLHYMNARHYNPTSGRFLTEDTYNDPLSSDLYSYAGNNSVNYVDPTGHVAIALGGVALLAAKASVWFSTAYVAFASISASEWVMLKTATDVFAAARAYEPRPASNTGNTASPYLGNTVIRNYQSPWMTHASGMGDIIWGTPSGDISGTIGNNTSIPLSSHSESLLNGIPSSQELSRVSENVARIQDKAGENVADGTDEAIEDVLSGVKETTNGKGIARNFEKSGGYEQTLKDFDRLNPTKVKDIQTQYGPGKVGTLSNGTKVVARQGSTTGGPTLEIVVSKKRIFKVRY